MVDSLFGNVAVTVTVRLPIGQGRSRPRGRLVRSPRSLSRGAWLSRRQYAGPRTRRLALIDQPRTTEPEEPTMGDKSPKHENAKKPARSLKEKRADKQAKKASKRPGVVN